MRKRASVHIVRIPYGEAPLWVREAWVGLELPLATDARAYTGFAFGVVSGPRRVLAQWWGVLTGRASRLKGYVVPAPAAVELLAQRNPEAAQWWREHTPHLSRRGQTLLFDEGCGRPEA